MTCGNRAIIFERLVISEMDYMTQSLETVKREALHQAVELMNERKRIFIFGVGPSVSLVDLMKLRLERFGKPGDPADDGRAGVPGAAALADRA